MARVDIGEALTEPKLAPGWKVSDDGFGLRTCTAVYNVDIQSGFDFIRGEAFPVSGYDYLKLHKQTASFNALGYQVQTCEYVGISPDVNGGAFTIPNMSSANGLTSENITAHPNFFNAQDGYIGAIAGPPPYEQDTQNNLAPTVNKAPAFIGLNGACFEKAAGGRFIGFVDPEFKSLYGKTQYLATSTTFTGVIYVSSEANVTAILGYLNQSSPTTSWGSWELLPDWATVGTSPGIGPKNLLSQVNVESFGSLYKVTYEIRFADRGWDSNVYKEVA